MMKTMMTSRAVLAGVGAVLLIGLASCDNGPSAVRGRDRDAGQAGYQPSGGGSGGYADRNSSSRDRQDGAGRDGGSGGRAHDSWWASSRKHSATEGAQAQFQRDGAQFGATDVNDYVSKAHAFVSHPPHGTLTMERKNGDVLLYDPKANIFAVATRDGAPRTMFKPNDGMAYWEKQKASLSGRPKSNSRSDDQS